MQRQPAGSAQYQQPEQRAAPEPRPPPQSRCLRIRCGGMRHEFQDDASNRPAGRREAVSNARQSYYISRLTCGVAERLPELIDGRIEPVFEVTSSHGGPEKVAKSVTRQHLSGTFQQRAHNLSRLRGKLESVPVFPQLPRL